MNETSVEYLRQAIQLLTLATTDPAAATAELNQRLTPFDPDTVLTSEAVAALEQMGVEAMLLAHGLLGAAQLLLEDLTRSSGETPEEAMQRIALEVANQLEEDG